MSGAGKHPARQFRQPLRPTRNIPGFCTPCRPLVVILSWLAWSAGPGAGQSLVSGTIEGTVRDIADRPLFAVTITVTSQASGRRWILRTDRSGYYTLENLAAGRYDALFERLGFAPERVVGIELNPGTRRDLSMRLLAAEGPAVQTRVRSAAPSPGTLRMSGPDRWTTVASGSASLPFDAGDLSGLAATSSLAGPRLDVEGLPVWMQTILIDGIPSVQRLNPHGFRSRAATFPLATLSMAQLIAASTDVEYPGTAGSYFAGATRPAGASMVHVWGDGAFDALAFGTDEVASFQSYRAGALIGGAIIPDTAGVLVGAEYSKAVVPYASIWTPAPGGSALEKTARDRYGIELAPWSKPTLETAERVSAFARLDAQLGANHMLNLRGLFGAQPTTSWILPSAEQPVGAAHTAKSTEFFSAATLVSSIAEGEASNELNLGFELSSIERGTVVGGLADLPATRVAGAALGFGDPSDRLSESRVWSAYARNTITIPVAGHRFKLGTAIVLPSYKVIAEYGPTATFLFSGISDFAGGAGYYAGVEGAPRARDWTESRILLYGQDSWKPSPDVEVLAGVRVHFFKNADTAKVRLEDRWRRLSGLRNRSVPRRNVEFEPRFLLTWRPEGTGLLVTGSMQVDAQPMDPAHVAELLVRDGLLNVRRGFSRFTSYPSVRDTGTAKIEGPTVSLLGPEFQGPRSSRLTGTITKEIASLLFSVSGTVRKTEFLAQRKDLNLLPLAAAHDQFGRPIYGALRKEGALLFADGESNRRFPEFDEVWGLQATGVSTYRGLTITAERRLQGPLGFRASYTVSNTEDDWLQGMRGDPRSELNPFADSLSRTDWATARSDLDVPHRAVIGAELQLPGSFAPRLAAIYRYQSGYPFTPGFRDGVDANADGSASNDPAFLSESIPGTSELLSRWSCLAGHREAFVARNACRGPDIHALDARVTVGITRPGRYTAQLVVDALNLVAPEDIVPDRALYLVDAARDLVVSPNGRNVTVPLIANAAFGETVARYAPQRVVRFGLRLSW